MTKIKPIHKFNNSRGATLCHKCTVIITTGLTKDLYCEKCKPKQETLEEVIEKLFRHYPESSGYKKAALIGKEWQQERSYSEEDMIDFAKFMLLENHEYKSYTDIFNEWFEQFKKK